MMYLNIVKQRYSHFPGIKINLISFSNIRSEDDFMISFLKSLIYILSLEKKYELYSDENNLHLNLKDHPSGIYLIVFDFNKYTLVTRKICHLRGVENPCTE